MKIDMRQPPKGTIASKDEFSSAPPGYGLTLDNERWPWGKPPQIVDPEQAMNEAISSLEVTKIKRELMKLLMVGASVESIIEGYLFQSFQEGKFTPDVGLLIKGPLAMYLAAMAEEEGIPYRFFENDDELEQGEMSDETFFTMLKQNNPAMFAFIREQINEGIRQGHMPDEPKQENFLSAVGDK
jgi:hypothetical protein